MAPKVSKLLSFIFLLFPLLSHAKEHFAFLAQLHGSHKGDNVTGLHQLKNYLKKFGYLNYPHTQTHANDDNFDDFLESSIKTYQLNYRLKATGKLDAPTVSKMMTPRCGVPDIINGKTRMRSARKRHPDHHGNSSFTVSHYAFFDNFLKWPSDKTELTYTFLWKGRSDVRNAIGQAFTKWEYVTNFTFTEINADGDITVAFYRGDHGDGSPFDGPGGIITHAFAPTDGRLHFDVEEQYSIGAVDGCVDLETVALHGIGHLLGLEHSSVEDAIMFSEIPRGTTKRLNRDDINGIRALYNLP